MTSKLRALGLMLLAALVLSALSASAASAATHHITSSTETGLTSLTAKADTAQAFYTTTSDASTRLECENANLSGDFEGAETTEITVTPSYTGCKAFKEGSEFVEQVTFNNCHYTFTGETSEDVTKNQSAKVNLTCPGKGPTVDVTVFNFPCIEVEPNQTLQGATYANDVTTGGEHSLTLEAKVHGITSVTEGVCGEGTHNDGLYEGKVTVTGYEDAKHEKTVDLNLKTT